MKKSKKAATAWSGFIMNFGAIHDDDFEYHDGKNNHNNFGDDKKAGICQ